MCFPSYKYSAKSRIFIISVTMFRLLLVSALVAVALGASPRIRPRVPVLDGRIIGGVDTTIEEHPHQISLQFDGSHICGGSIIGPNKILTAAHCIYGNSVIFFTVRHSSSTMNTGGSVAYVYSTTLPSAYDPSTSDYDVSYLTLFGDIVSDLSKPIALADPGTVEGGRTATVTGWGTTSDGDLSDTLQVVEVVEVDRNECNENYSGGITDRMICFAADGKDSCQGDSGGPLVVNNVQVGIVSWGYGCAEPGYPGVYSNVANLRDYID